MTENITLDMIRQNNCQMIYAYIHQNQRVSQQDIVAGLHLSRPTVAARLADLEAGGLICKKGYVQSDQQGRKAIAYAIVPSYRVAIGVEIRGASVKVVAVNLFGKTIQLKIIPQLYVNDTAYYRDISGAIERFIRDLPVSAEQILGIGFTIQGLISPDGRTVVYGEILGCTDLQIDIFERWLNYPCMFLHDPDSAALLELWESPDIVNAIYLSLSAHLGGSIISGGRIILGKHGHSGTFEHISLDPEGEMCYCGKRGCIETLCSVNALTRGESTASFFEKVEEGDADHCRRWMQYLKNLARLINLLHLVYDFDFILGGHIAAYFKERDIQLLYQEIRNQCPFEDARDFIHISKCPSHNIAIGASLPYIRGFLKSIPLTV